MSSTVAVHDAAPGMACSEVDRIIRRRAAFAMVGLSPSAVERLIRAGSFPRPIPLVPGGRSVGFLQSEISAWIAERVAERDACAARDSAAMHVDGARVPRTQPKG